MPELMNTIMADGPSSNPSQPVKALLRAWGTWVEGIITAFLSNGGLIYDTKAHMDADLAHGANSSAWVVSDATVANNGIYRKLGASGAGSWTRVADLPYSFIAATDAGAGTANAIVATTSIPLPSANGAALISLNIFENNTGPATVSFNGGAALTIKTNAGNDVQANYLVAGMIVAGYVSGSTFRLISEIGTAADRAAAEAAAAAAAASAASINLPAISAADADKVLIIKPDGSGYIADKIAAANVVATATDPLRITIGNVTNPARFGTWDKTGAVDGSAAFTAAVASNKFVELGDGDFKISTKAVIANSQRRVIGAGKAITRLISSHASNHVIEIAAGLSDVIVEDLTTTRIVAPSVGAAGIGALGQLSTSCIRRVSSFASYYGMLLLSTGYSQLQDIFLSNNTGDGLRIQNTAASGPCQWYIDGLLSQANDGIGIRVQSVAGPAGLLLGDWRGVRTFANSSFGIALQGLVGTPVYGMRLHESFLGTDGNTELYLDTYGYGHKIHDVFMEIAGTGLTGSALTTPASGVGWGILGTAHNDDIRATDCTISGCSSGGFYSEATLTRVATTLFKSMGTGVNIADGGKYRENGCDFVSVTTPRTFVANPYNAHIVGSGSSLASTTGANPNATRIPAGVTIGVATAGDPLAGGMNVAAGLWKNNTAYANP
ncbi:hypothetical protein [Mesorhizobium sp. B2-5-11]|uniref:hypothetical protein n=1 Tax=Mesorhizobium sp. B2-5-11 TaxID=2589919 RepID=UPI00112E0E5D|nr:hypothetical protein [Mesorhizobium sp. B2-5-11]TPK14175.1 hypothetical protein FJ490_02310 [Mesorhizobium sp. B2-5-11]